jgi:PAS domain S-box-containing protein
VYRDESGKVQGVFAAARDITERKQTEEALLKKTDDLNVAYEELTAQNEELTANLEELARQERALRESEERFRTLVAGAKDYAIFALDPGGTILSWNEGAARIKGYQTDEIVGRNFSVFYLPEDIQNGKPEEELKIARNSGRFETDALRIRKGGTQFWANVIITPMRNERGEVTGFSKITRDITERKQAEEALEKKTDDLNAAYENLTATEEELRANLEELTRQELALRDLNAYNRSLLEASIDPLVTISPEGRITDVNTSTEKVTGHSGEELIGTDFSDYFTEPEKAKEGYHRVFTDGTIRDYPLEVRHTDGHITPVLYNATVYRDETGKVSGVFAAARDVTELKSTQDALEQKAQELTRSNIELEQFAFIASHDLQEPLRMIASFVQLIESEYKGKLGEDGDRWIGFAVDGSKRLQAMINGLLLYSRVETKGNIFSNVDLEIVLREVLGGADMIIQETKSEITHEPLPVVYGDPGQLIQLLQNLILNGIKFNKKTPPKVHISAQKKKNNWVVSVRDNGIGIADADRDKLFLMFRRISRKEYPGTGIGLALCKRIVDRHGGKIWVDSKEGEGSVFSFNIPIVTENHHVKT